MSRFELTRYLDYCAEMLALIGKLAALYAERMRDSVVINAVNDIENLTTGLGRKIWQKITIISALRKATAELYAPFNHAAPFSEFAKQSAARIAACLRGGRASTCMGTTIRSVGAERARPRRERLFARASLSTNCAAWAFAARSGAGRPMRSLGILLQEAQARIVLIEWIEPASGSTSCAACATSEEVARPRRAYPDADRARRAGRCGGRARGRRQRLHAQTDFGAGARATCAQRVSPKPQPFVATAAYVGPCRRRRADRFSPGHAPARRCRARRQPVADEEVLDLKAEIARARVAALEQRCRR